jgi:cholesterol transport system auxiliary component
MKVAFLVLGVASCLVACNPLKPAADQPLSFYSLNLSSASLPQAAGNTANLPTLIVNPPHAAEGFDTAKMIYLREKYQIQYYAQSEWVAPPPKMLAPLIVERLMSTGNFKAVVLTPTAALADLRLTVEIVRLQHEFFDAPAPSRVRFTIRAHMMDEKTRKVLVVREFNAVVNAPTDNAVGGVTAANQATKMVMDDMAAMVASILPAK